MTTKEATEQARLWGGVVVSDLAHGVDPQVAADSAENAGHWGRAALAGGVLDRLQKAWAERAPAAEEWAEAQEAVDTLYGSMVAFGLGRAE